MLPSRGYQGATSHGLDRLGWLHRGNRWALIWNAREVATVRALPGGGAVVWLDLGKMWESEEIRAPTAEDGRRYAERRSAAALCPGIPEEQAIAKLGGDLELAPLPTAEGLPPGFRWIKANPKASERTVVAFGEQWVVAIHQDSPRSPMQAILALHLDFPEGRRPVRTCSSLRQGKAGAEIWVARHCESIVREIQQARRRAQLPKLKM